METTKQKYILMLSVGPVQSFITESRKSRDLYASSLILSELADKALGVLKEAKAEIVFPAKDSSSAPNRFVAVLEDRTQDEVHDIGKKAENSIRFEFVEMAKYCFRELYNDENYPEGFLKTIKGHLEIYWTFVAWDKEKTYADAFSAAAKSLKEIKLSPFFEQNIVQEGISQEEIKKIEQALLEQAKTPADKSSEKIQQALSYEKDKMRLHGKKCSLTGRQKAVFRPGSAGSNPVTTLEKKPPFRYLPKKQADILDDEALGAIGFLKRFYVFKDSGNEKFKPVSSVALLHNNFKEEELKFFWSFFKEAEMCHDKTLKRLGLPKVVINENVDCVYCGHFEDVTQYLFEENIAALKNKGQQEMVQAAFNKHFKNKIKPETYYAVVMFDGDSIGKRLDPEEDAKRENLKETHKNLAERLEKFAKANKKLIKGDDKPETCLGQSIYMGGDDGLAFINIRRLTAFIDGFRKNLEKTNENQSDPITFSMGVYIGHYKSPMREGLENARNALEEAKKLGDRDALCLRIAKGKENNRVLMKWTNFKDFKALTDRFADDLSDSFVRPLGEFVAMHEDDKGVVAEMPDAMFMANLKTLLRKKQGLGAQSAIETAGIISNLWYAGAAKLNKAASNFIFTLRAAEFMARKK